MRSIAIVFKNRKGLILKLFLIETPLQQICHKGVKKTSTPITSFRLRLLSEQTKLQPFKFG